MKHCGASGPTVETHRDFGLGATGPRLLAPPGPFKALSRTGPTVEKLSSLLIFSAGVGERRVAGGVNGCVERCSGWVCFFFQTYSKNHSNSLPVVDSPECWGVVSCNW